MAGEALTRDVCRAVLADPDSTPEQRRQVRLFLAKRIAGTSERIAEALRKYNLSPEQRERLTAMRSPQSLEWEARAREEVERLEQSPAPRVRPESVPEGAE